MAPFVLRRLKSQVANQLPSKTVVVHKCELVPEQRQAYDTFLAESKQKLSSVASLKNQKAKQMMNHTLSYLRQLSNHLCLHRWFYDDTKLHKMARLIRKVRKCMAVLLDV